MRPVRIELEGIGSFQEPVTLDLADVDLFVLSGPTGAGKTTLLVDAMMLALYGTVPRYDDRRLVAPIVHQGSNEGRVRVTFALGNRTFAATRVVRRTKQGGATTKEARLEEVTGGGEVVHAGTADEVTAAVTRLIGLTFDQFCRSVVLPQGAFDRFLFAKPAERADLLIQLLDLGLHAQIGQRARAAGTAATARADAADRRLQGDLADATVEALQAAERRVTALTALAEHCQQAQDELDRLRESGVSLKARTDAAAAEANALEALTRPADVDALAAATRADAAAHAAAVAAHEEAAAKLDEAEAARGQLPDAEVLASLARATEEAASAEAALPPLAEAAVAADRAAQQAAANVGRAEEALAAARHDHDEARRQELVHAVADGLHSGDPCPVCGMTLTAEPQVGDASATVAAAQALETAEADYRLATASQGSAGRAAAAASAQHEAAQQRLEAALIARGDALARAGVTGPEGAAALLAQVQAADEAVRAARDAERAARQRQAATVAALARSREAEATAWATFERARDAVAALGPPTADRSDLAGAWDQLLAWAGATRPEATARADQLVAQVAEVREQWSQADSELRQACRTADVDVPARSRPGEAVADALGAARARHEALVARCAEAEVVAKERDDAREEAAVAEDLGRLLRADGFERWLLARALTRLVGGASALLRELTSGTYSLALDEANQFLVIDHRNADEPRTAKSLSGGERFLASLALALALADHVAELAAEGAARLESLFLDEGFGTLDQDTLDIVAAALEELGSRGRVVGIVTHVRELAERLPVRFEVRRGPGGSTVERTDSQPLTQPPGERDATGTDQEEEVA